MKKIFVAVMAMAAFAACSTEEQIAAPKGQEIAFGDAFVDNATKAIYDNDENLLNEFQVWGNLTGNGSTVQLYNGALVERKGQAYGDPWTCGVTRYWTPSCAYEFVAIAHAESVTLGTDHLPATITYVADGDKDLLLSNKVAASTNAACVIDGANGGVVAFTMNHLLSKLHFAVNHSLGSDYDVVPTSIQVTGAKKNGTYTIADTIADGTWAINGDATVGALELLNTDRVIIPGNQTLSVVITYDIKFGVGEGDKTTIATGVTKTAPLTVDFAKNTAYNVTVTIGATAIQFTVDNVAGFNTPETNVNI